MVYPRAFIELISLGKIVFDWDKWFVANAGAIDWLAVRAQGSGGQNVNKVSSAVHLRFDIDASDLPDRIKQRLRNRRDQRVNKDAVIVIKAQQYRTQVKNRDDAMQRLQLILEQAMVEPKRRIVTKPTKAAKQRRLKAKTIRGERKQQRKIPLIE